MPSALAASPHFTRPDRLNGVLLAALECCPVPVTISDLTQRDDPLLYVNRAFCEMTGYAPEDVVGRNCRFLQGPESDPAVIAAMGHTVRARRSGEFEIINRRRDGSRFLNRLELAPVVDPQTGEPVAMIGLARDISRFRAQEAARREREKLEALGRMAGGFAHEVNNLLQPILSLAPLVRDALPVGEEDAREAAEALVDSARAARDLSRRVLGVARTGAPREAARDLPGLVQRAVGLAAAPLAGRACVAVEVAPGYAPRAAVAAGEMAQVVANLLVNAADAMAQRGHVRVSLAPDGPGKALLSVEDDGEGMDEATRARAFEPFFTTKPVGQGTGLGLAAVWGLVRGWGGTVAIESTPGAGTSIRLRIPVTEE